MCNGKKERLEYNTLSAHTDFKRPFRYKALDGLITEIEGHGLIKSAQLDFSKRQMALYRIQGHDLITEVIRYDKVDLDKRAI